MKKKKLNITIKSVKYEKISAEEEKKLIKRCRTKNEDARNKLINIYFPYVAGVSKKYHSYFPWIEFEELIEEGNYGLLKALDHFNEKKKTRFSSYAWFWIIRYIQEYITKLLMFFRVSSRVLKNLRKINKIMQKAVNENKNLTLEEVTEKLDIELDEIKDLLVEQIKVSTPVSLDQYIDFDDQRITLKDIIPSKDLDSESLLEESEGRDGLLKLFDILNDQESEIIRWRFGFNDNKYHSLREVAKKMRLSPQKVRDLELLALTKLKKSLSTKEL